MTERISTLSRNLVFAASAVLSLALDQWTKGLARTHLSPLAAYGHKKTVIANYFDLRFSENTGVAFGMFQNLPGGKYLLSLVGLVALGLVVYYLLKSGPRQTRMHLALGLIFGGAVGNLIDRIFLSKVTDFIVWHVGRHEWPAFNIADAALVVGVALMALDMLLDKRRQSDPAPAASGPVSSKES
jgi:signal peptidase II